MRDVLLAAVLAGGFCRATGEPELPASGADQPAATFKGRPSVRLELDPADAVLTSQFSAGTNSQEVKFDKPVKGRFFCLESLSAWDGRAYAAVAELDLLAASGQRLSRAGWKIAYADSEEHEREDGSAENAIDGNPATYWHTQWSSSSPNHPHHLVLDLGKSCVIAGFRYLPRPGGGTVGGRIKDYRVYVGDHLLEENAPDKELPEHCYLAAYFVGGGDGGLQLAYSLNGYRWDPLNRGRSVLTPEVGDKLMRDPCLWLAPDGTFHLVWTAAWTGNYIGYASSKDLIHWSAQTAIPVMTNEPATLNCWAPEIFRDPRTGQFLIFWASTVTNQFGGAGQNHNRIYCTTTKDFKTFSPTKLFFDPGYGAIDATLLQDQNRFYLVFEDQTVRHLRVAVADRPEGPFGPPGPVIEADYAEGPMLFRPGPRIVACYHLIDADRCGALATADLTHWENISAGMFLPPGCKQGALLQVPGQTLKPFLQTGRLALGATPAAAELGLGDWIWTAPLTDRQACHLWRAFDVPATAPVVRAVLRMTADNSYTVYLDGREIGRGGDPNSLAEYDLTWLLPPGRHVLAVEAFNDTFDAGVILGLRLKLADGQTREVLSDPSWRVVTGDVRHWRTRPQADPAWWPAQIVGFAGQGWWQYPAQIIRVPPLRPPVEHWWQQGWVLAVLLLAGVSVAVLWVRQGLRLAWQTRAHRLLERERARLARDLHDDLGAGLTQLTLLGELALRDIPPAGSPCGITPQPEPPPTDRPTSQGEPVPTLDFGLGTWDVQRARLNAVCAKARALLGSLDEIVWAVNPRRDTVKDFAAYLSEHAEEYLAATAIRCRQDVAPELPAIPLDLPQRRNLLLAVKEAIRNAARHSGADEVSLQLRVVDHCLQVVIEDNGKGFSPTDTQVNRNGLVNMKQRLADVGGSFMLHTAPGKGCRVTFLLPCGVAPHPAPPQAGQINPQGKKWIDGLME